MADLLNVSRNTIYRLEQYTGLPPKIDLYYVQQYSDITGKSLCWLLLGVDIQATADMTEARLLELEDVLTRSIQSTFKALKTESFSALKK